MNNFTDFELLYDKFGALQYNGKQIRILKQSSERVFLHNFEQTGTDKNNL